MIGNVVFSWRYLDFAGHLGGVGDGIGGGI